MSLEYGSTRCLIYKKKFIWEVTNWKKLAPNTARESVTEPETFLQTILRYSLVCKSDMEATHGNKSRLYILIDMPNKDMFTECYLKRSLNMHHFAVNNSDIVAITIDDTVLVFSICIWKAKWCVLFGCTKSDKLSRRDSTSEGEIACILVTMNYISLSYVYNYFIYLRLHPKCDCTACDEWNILITKNFLNSKESPLIRTM